MLNQVRLKSSLLEHEGYNTLSAALQLILMRLLFTCNSYGVFDARPVKLAVDLFPRDNPIAVADSIEQALRALEAAGAIRRVPGDTPNSTVGAVVWYAELVVPHVVNPSKRMAEHLLLLAVMDSDPVADAISAHVNHVSNDEGDDPVDEDEWARVRAELTRQCGKPVDIEVQLMARRITPPDVVLSRILEQPLNQEDAVIDQLDQRGLL